MKNISLITLGIGVILGLITGGAVVWSMTNNFVDNAVNQAEERFNSLLEEEKEKLTLSRDEFAEELKSTELNLMAKKMFKSNIKRGPTTTTADSEESGIFEKEFNFQAAAEVDETLKEKKERLRQEKI